MNCQSNKFQLDPEVHYLNGAYMSPLLKSSEDKAVRGAAPTQESLQLSG